MPADAAHDSTSRRTRGLLLASRDVSRSAQLKGTNVKRFQRYGAALLAASTAAAALLTGSPAHAEAFGPCDNADATGAVIVPETPTVLPGGIGTIYVRISTQDSYVKYDGPGDAFDTLVGVDLQDLSLAQDTAVCVYLPVVGGLVVLVNVVDLRVQVCTQTGRPADANYSLSCTP